MFQAVLHPWRRLEAFRPDGLAVDGAQPERARIDSSQCAAHQAQDCRIELGFGEVLAGVLTGDAGIARVSDACAALLAAQSPFLRHAGDEVPLELKQTLFIRQSVHAHSP
jgi:hypothetical protein